MAKKKTTDKPNGKPKATATLSKRDKDTLSNLKSLADGVVTSAAKKKDPFLEIPSRTLTNVRFNKSKKIIEMGSGTNRRLLFDLNQAKAYMRTMLVASGVNRLIGEGKTTSLRGMFYMLKHTIEGTKENTFDEQSECDPIVEDLEVTLDSLREALHLYADDRGAMVGSIVINDSGDQIDCARMGSGGYAIPSIVEPEVMQFAKCDAEFILHVEKGTVWRRFNEDKFWQKHKCILTHGGGQPPRGVRRLLHRMHNELQPGGAPRKKESDPKLPVYCVLDNDPWGYYIYSVLKQGSINLAYESKRMAVPEAKFLGVRSMDFERCKLPDSVKINLNENDRKRAKQIAKYPWFEGKAAWQKEIQTMLDNDFKLEVEALVARDISYVTEEYVPERIAETKLWLD
jgi:DNA topoisomerase-6 subunit A